MSSDDENALPPFASTRPASPQPRQNASLLKRSRGYDSSNSSDIPFFSSDDLAEASLDNYQTPRPKKLNRRTWWQKGGQPSQVLHRQHFRRYTKRFHDSGVFMASDSSSSNEDGFGIEQLPIRGHRRQDTKIAIAQTSRRTPVQQTLSQGEERAAQTILDCLDNCHEVVDLSNMSLASLSNETLQRLHGLISDTKGSYQTLVPKLQLILATNLLTRVPSEIVKFGNLTVLSLRHNSLTELPHSLGKLVNLVELNVAGNKLRWLPAEILDLVRGGKLVNLRVHPNPFFQATAVAENSGGTIKFASAPRGAELVIKHLQMHIQSRYEDADERNKYEWILKIQQNLADRFEECGTRAASPRLAWRQRPIHLGSTPVTFYDFDGSVPRTTHPAPSRLGANIAVVRVAVEDRSTYPTDCRLPAVGRMPSLFELAARACGDHLRLANVEEIFDGQDPESITRVLCDVRSMVDEDGWHCSVCRKRFVVPRAEWIEYWHCIGDSLDCSFDELYLPFLRRTCSWVCAGDRTSH